MYSYLQQKSHQSVCFFLKLHTSKTNKTIDITPLIQWIKSHQKILIQYQQNNTIVIFLSFLQQIAGISKFTWHNAHVSEFPITQCSYFWSLPIAAHTPGFSVSRTWSNSSVAASLFQLPDSCWSRLLRSCWRWEIEVYCCWAISPLHLYYRSVLSVVFLLLK